MAAAIVFCMSLIWLMILLISSVASTSDDEHPRNALVAAQILLEFLHDIDNSIDHQPGIQNTFCGNPTGRAHRFDLTTRRH